MLPITIGVSRCLTGELSRYDGRAKYSKVCCSQLDKIFELYPVCPEVESGLSIPRPPIELVQFPKRIKVLGRDNSSLDVTDQLLSFCDQQATSFALLSGFVLTPRSPSCGLNSVEIKSPEGRLLSKSSNGLFVSSLIKHFPYLPLIEEPYLAEEDVLSLFQVRVIVYHLIKQGEVFSKELLVKCIYRDLMLNIEETDSKESQMMVISKRLGEMSRAQVTNLLAILKENQSDI